MTGVEKKIESFDFDQELNKLEPHLQRRVTNAKRGRNRSYNKQWCDILLLMYAKGRTMSQFCAEVGICRATFFNTLKNEGHFLDTYRVAQEIQRSWFHDIQTRVLDGTERMDNSRYLMFEQTYRRRFAAGDSGHNLTDLTSCKNDADKIAYIFGKVQTQELTIEHAALLLQSLKSSKEIQHYEELQDRLEALKSTHEAK